MQILISGKNLEIDNKIRTHIERRTYLGLSRFENKISKVIIRLSDINGPRGGEDKTCSVEIRLKPLSTVFVQDTDSNLFASIDRAIEKSTRSVARKFEKIRSKRQIKSFDREMRQWTEDRQQQEV